MSDLHRFIEKFDKAAVLLIGDTIVDEYVYGTVIGTSAETPTIVAREIEQKTFLGGAFLVARHLLTLGAKVRFCTLVGEDPSAVRVTGFSHPKLELLPASDAGRKTTVKRRFWVDGYKLLQFDQLDNRPFADFAAMAPALSDAMRKSDVVVVSDNRHGLMSPAMIEGVVRLAKEARKPLYVDSQVSQSAANHTLYRGADLVCLNLKEARAIDGAFEVRSGEMGKSDFAGLTDRLGVPHVIVKLGDKGAVAWLGDRFWRSDAIKIQVVDTCGAGDAFLAAFCLGGLDSPADSLAVANAWAGLATTIHGTVPPTIERLRDVLSGGSAA